MSIETDKPSGAPGKYDEVLKPFVALMERELHANSGKGDRPGWLQMDRKTALLEIFYHLAKLQKAALNNDLDGVREYAADVANMSMMLVDVCGSLPAAEQPTAQEAVPYGYLYWSSNGDGTRSPEFARKLPRRYCEDWEVLKLYTRPAEPAAVPELNPEELVIEAWPAKQVGMHVGMPRGVKIMHVPSRIVAACDSERSQHRNRDLAMHGIRSMLAAREGK